MLALPNALLHPIRIPIVAVGLPLVLGSLSGFPTYKVVRGEWYNSLRAPPLSPPRRAFGIVWPMLYVSMGLASHLAVRVLDDTTVPSLKEAARKGISLYWAQLALNLIWTPIYFGWKKKGLALIDLTVMTGLVYAMTVTLHEPTNGVSTYLLVPYCVWTTFATYLNAGYWWLNRNNSANNRKGK